MSLLLPASLPAIHTLQLEHVNNIIGYNADNMPQTDCLHIVILNLMPKKQETETDLARMLAYSSKNLKVSFMKLRSHTPKNTSSEHMQRFYHYPDDLKDIFFDGMIITGAPVETINYEEVDYWQEFTAILDWARTHVRSTLYLCWGAMAALYYFYGIPKHLLPTKRFGVFPITTFCSNSNIFRGFNDSFVMPNSRHTEVLRSDIDQTAGVEVIAESTEAGVCIAAADKYSEFYVLGHFEYPVWTLNDEYHRDLGKRNDVELPQHYYPEDDSQRKPVCNWRAAATLFYNNWINYYVSPQHTDNNIAL